MPKKQHVLCFIKMMVLLSSCQSNENKITNQQQQQQQQQKPWQKLEPGVRQSQSFLHVQTTEGKPSNKGREWTQDSENKHEFSFFQSLSSPLSNSFCLLFFSFSFFLFFLLFFFLWGCLLIFVCFVRLYTIDLYNYGHLCIVCFSLSCKALWDSESALFPIIIIVIIIIIIIMSTHAICQHAGSPNLMEIVNFHSSFLSSVQLTGCSTVWRDLVQKPQKKERKIFFNKKEEERKKERSYRLKTLH